MRNAFMVLFFLSSGPLMAQTNYDLATAQDRPVLAANLGSGHYANGRPFQTTRLPNGALAATFDGTGQYLEVPSAPRLSVPFSGALTIEAWIRPDTLQFRDAESDGYVYWLGKGEAGEFEYAGRMYSLNNSANRPNRISGYAYNLAGGLGSGSYFEDRLARGQWIYVVIAINSAPSPGFPSGCVKIYRDGVRRDVTGLNQFGVVPAAGSAPLRIGTRDFNSFFQGAIGKVALYGRELPPARILAHFRAMTGL